MLLRQNIITILEIKTQTTETLNCKKQKIGNINDPVAFKEFGVKVAERMNKIRDNWDDECSPLYACNKFPDREL